MPENHPTHDPGHLDIDAVSAFVDRDLDPADLASIEVHLTRCPACDREVLEIRTTVVLLAALPQYAPRRSFCLGSEHARAGRRQAHGRAAAAWEPPSLTAGQPGPGGGAIAPSGAPGLGWMPGLQVAALVVGALLLLVTAGDLTGLVPNGAAPAQLAAPTAQEPPAPAPPMAAMPAPEAARSNMTAADDRDVAEGESATAPFEAAFQPRPETAGGTENADSASQEMLASEAQAPRLAATSAAVAAVTQAIPTPGAAANPSDGGSGADAASGSATVEARPSRLRIVQIGLALLLAWLVVSIAGLRWVRRTRQA